MPSPPRGECWLDAAATAASPLDIVVVEDSASDFELLQLRLRAAGWNARLSRVETQDELAAALDQPCGAVICDHQLPGFTSLDSLALVRARDPDLPFLVLSGTIGPEVAVAVMRAGADDYIMKHDLARVSPALEHAIDNAAIRRRRREAEAALAESEARFRALAANLPGVVFQLQGTGAALALAYVNEGTRRLFGLTAEEVAAAPERLFDLVAPDPWEDLGKVLVARTGPAPHVNWVRHVSPHARGRAEWIEFHARARTLASGAVAWDCVVYDITPQKRAEEELMHSREELRDLAKHLTAVREQEREAIARDIHDDVGSTLNAIKFELAWVHSQCRDDPAVAQKLTQVDQLLVSAIHTSQRIMHDLRPGILDEGIVPSLEWQARSFAQRMGIPCTFTASDDDLAVDRDCAIALFRICQEALNNVAKHARATAVDVSLLATGDRIELDVHDNGVGVAPDALGKRECFGLRGMRERATSLGGGLKVAGERGRGTTISVWLPREHCEDADLEVRA